MNYRDSSQQKRARQAEWDAHIYNRSLLRDTSVIMFIDTCMIALSLIIGNLILYWVNGIPFSIVNGWLIVPLWLAIALIAKLFPDGVWGL